MGNSVCAILGYGFMLTHDEYETYLEKRYAEEEYESDFCMWVDVYNEKSDVFFGVRVFETETNIAIGNMHTDDREWEACNAEFRASFPEKKDTTPQYFLISHWT